MILTIIPSDNDGDIISVDRKEKSERWKLKLKLFLRKDSPTGPGK